MVKMALSYPHHEVSKNDILLRDQLPAALIENQLFKIFKQLTPHVLCSLRAMYCFKTNQNEWKSHDLKINPDFSVLSHGSFIHLCWFLTYGHSHSDKLYPLVGLWPNVAGS